MLARKRALEGACFRAVYNIVNFFTPLLANVIDKFVNLWKQALSDAVVYEFLQSKILLGNDFVGLLTKTKNSLDM